MHSWNNIFDIGARKVLRHTHVHTCMCKISAQYAYCPKCLPKDAHKTIISASITNIFKYGFN